MSGLIIHPFTFVKGYFIVHTKNGNPIPVKKELQKVIKKNVKSLLALNDKGLQVTFTDINKLREPMVHEMNENRID